MKYGEWTEADFTMHWSIYLGDYGVVTEVDGVEAKEPMGEYLLDFDMNEWELDLRAPDDVQDGSYQIRYNGEVSASGALVEDGLFVPVATERACLEAVCGYYGVFVEDAVGSIDHLFIEDFEYDEGTGVIEVYVGS